MSLWRMGSLGGIGRVLGRRGMCLESSLRSSAGQLAVNEPSGRDGVGPFIIGVAGASASGKTSVCDRLIQGLNHHRCLLVSMDWFYYGIPDNWPKSKDEYNFDHPDALDFPLMRETMKKVIEQDPVAAPTYSFHEHRRQLNSKMLPASDVVILEGIFAFYDKELRDMMQMKVFVDEDADLCLSRRIRRDVSGRGRNLEEVLDQYERFVKPSFDELIVPTKRYADLIIPRGRENHVAINLLLRHLEQKLDDSHLSRLYSNLIMPKLSAQIRMLVKSVEQHSAFGVQNKETDLKISRLASILFEKSIGATSSPWNEIPSRIVAVPLSRASSQLLVALSNIAPTAASEVIVESSEKLSREDRMKSDVTIIFDHTLRNSAPVLDVLSRIGPKRLLQEQVIVTALRTSENVVKEVCSAYPTVKLVTAAVFRTGQEPSVRGHRVEMPLLQTGKRSKLTM